MYEQDFAYEDGILFIRLSGQFPLELLDSGENLFQPLADACTTYSCNRAIVDARELRVDLGTMGLFQAGEDISDMSRLGFRVALVAREDMIDSFFEDVAVNRGGVVGVFTNIDEARHWITSRDTETA